MNNPPLERTAAAVYFTVVERRACAAAAAQRPHVIPAVEHTPTSSPFDAPKAAAQVVAHFKMGAICPAEMWAQLADVLSRGDVNQVLDTLPPDLQAEVRESYRERPLSFSTLRDSPLQRQIENWCRAPATRRQG